MSDPYERMKASGIDLPPSPRPAGSYAPGKVYGSLVFASGQTPTREGVPAYRGRVGADLGVEEAYAAARLAALNCLAELEAVCGDLRRVEGDRLADAGHEIDVEGLGEQTGYALAHKVVVVCEHNAQRHVDTVGRHVPPGWG